MPLPSLITSSSLLFLALTAVAMMTRSSATVGRCNRYLWVGGRSVFKCIGIVRLHQLTRAFFCSMLRAHMHPKINFPFLLPSLSIYLSIYLFIYLSISKFTHRSIPLYFSFLTKKIYYALIHHTLRALEPTNHGVHVQAHFAEAHLKDDENP